MTPNEDCKTFREAVLEALLAPQTAVLGAMVVQHPITLAWDWFLKGTTPHSEVDGHRLKWRDLLEPGDEDRSDVRYVWIIKEAAQRAQATPSSVGVDNVIDYVSGRIIDPLTGNDSRYDYEQEVSTLTKQQVKQFNLLTGVLELGDAREIRAMSRMAEIHGSELFEWIEEYMIDHETDGHHKIHLKAFVNGIRYLIFYKLAGEEHGKTRVTSDMYRRLVSIGVGENADTWGSLINRCDASKDEAEIFIGMIRHGVTEERIEKLHSIDYIVEE